MTEQAVSKLLVSSKSESFRRMLVEGTVLLHLNPRVAGVEVPKQFQQNPSLVLQFGYQLPVPTVDVTIEQNSVSGTLLFGSENFKVTVPWTAVYAVTFTNGDGVLWSDDVPPELQPTTTMGTPVDTAKHVRPKPQLKLVP